MKIFKLQAITIKKYSLTFRYNLYNDYFDHNYDVYLNILPCDLLVTMPARPKCEAMYFYTAMCSVHIRTVSLSIMHTVFNSIKA